MATKIKPDTVRKAAKTGLEKAVAKWIIDRTPDYDGDPTGPLRDLFYGGCQSGMVGSLIYYRDTVKFYENHREDIWAIAVEQADHQGEPNAFAMLGKCPGAANCGDADQIANFLAWYGFEEAARIIADRIGY